MINNIKEMPEISIGSCLENSESKIYIGYIDDRHLENLPKNDRIVPLKLEITNLHFQIHPESTYTSFDKLNFYDLVTLKWVLFTEIFRLGYGSLIYSDLDVIWYSNVEENFKKFFENRLDVDVLIQDQSLDVNLPKLCMGLVSLRRTPRVEALIQRCFLEHKSRVANGELIGDDDVATDFYVSEKFPGWIYRLPQISYPVGMNFNAYLRNSKFPGLKPPRPLIFHANYVIGETNKRLLMRLANVEFKSDVKLGLYFYLILRIKKIRQLRRNFLRK
jgi:hypothetical protein